jgi:hypothetical protein
MKLSSKISFLFGLVAFILLLSCSREQTYPVVPYLEFKSYAVSSDNTQGLFTVSFTDGDGDVGLDDTDTISPFDTSNYYYNNFFINVFVKKNGLYNYLTVFNTQTQNNDTIIFKYRIARINPVSSNGSLNGTIQTAIDISLMAPYLKGDTIVFRAFLYDRALHKSNVVQSNDIYF